MTSISTKLFGTIILYVLTFLPHVHAQDIGGQQSFTFLNLSNSARESALGGSAIATNDGDISLASHNPALLNKQGHTNLHFSHSFYVGEVSHGLFDYGHYIAPLKMTFHAGFQYINYGNITATDEYGNVLGNTIKPKENALFVGASYPLYEKVTLGANLKFIQSHFDQWNSNGLCADIAAIYTDSASRFNATFVIRNIGFIFNQYDNNNKSALPTDVQLGISKKLAHLPFRISLIYHHFNKWNLLYDDPNLNDSDFIVFGEDTSTRSKFATLSDNFFRHFIINGEFLLGKKENLRLRIGYNHLRRTELKVNAFRSLAGFTGGIGFKINRFRVDYGYAVYHIIGKANQLSISTYINSF